MISIVAIAGELPNGQRVRKPTGTVEYALRHQLVLYVHNEAVRAAGKTPPVALTASPEVVFLVGEDGRIDVIPKTARLAVDFDTWQEAFDFVHMGPYEAGTVQTRENVRHGGGPKADD
jgi:hypothetical protein